MQQASLINRKKDFLFSLLKKAGIKIVRKFDIKDAAALKPELPLEQVRMSKRVFGESFGSDVFGCEKHLRDYGGKLEMSFECGIYTTEEGKSVHLVRVTDVKHVISQLVDELTQNNELKTPEILTATPFTSHF